MEKGRKETEKSIRFIFFDPPRAETSKIMRKKKNQDSVITRSADEKKRARERRAKELISTR